MHEYRWFIVFAAVFLLASCAQYPTYRTGERCVTPTFAVEDGFSGARRGQCTVLADDHVELRILPEDDGKINNSPWYAFRLVPTAPGKVTIALRYEGGNHRYWPKVSPDGATWSRLPETSVRADDDRRHAWIEIALDDQPLYVSAHELITPKVYELWNKGLSTRSGVPIRTIGESRRGLPINALDSNSESKEVLLLIGRQHPPEVSGAFAMVAFAGAVFGDSDLAKEFRERFRVIAVPLLNPDGVIGGNWRHNLGGKDLNRDWGPFTQPETQSIERLLDQLDASGSQLRMAIDFHSTRENVFYAHFDQTVPPDFTQRWINAARPRVAEDYPFDVSRSPIENINVAKNYLYRRYGIPAITYEVGDETERPAIRVSATVFAEELMRLMLKEDY